GRLEPPRSWRSQASAAERPIALPPDGRAGANRRTCLACPARELSASHVPAQAWAFLRQRRSKRELSVSIIKAASLLPSRPINLRQNRYLYEINSRWTIDGTSRKNLGRYANHSCRPNAETHRIGHKVIIRAIKNIRTGAEITYYGRDYLINVITRRRCKCDKCQKKRAEARAKARAKSRPAGWRR